ncbi:MAG: PD40 domain-containing protein, partial [Bacteroidales bacterium]|nr:PD40 domain-containing protein [Bacteroidales bacterium]
KETRLTYTDGLDDGPEYSPDGKYIYYNSYRSGRMQIWRMNEDGSDPLQLTNDAYANWFPHPSPDGKYIVFLSYINDQKQSHPFGKDVKLRLMDLNTREIRDLTNVFFGGQGTINVPSWSPDSQELAFVSFKLL